jgi:hypothetical protein
MNSRLRRRLLAGLPVLAAASVALAAGCGAHKAAELPYIEEAIVAKIAGFDWDTANFITVNESGSSIHMGNMIVDMSFDQNGHEYRMRTRERREALAARLNAWYRPVDLGVLTQLVNGVHPQTVIANLPDHVGKPFTPFLSPKTLAVKDREDFLERVADDLAFAERALLTTPIKFRNHVSYYLKGKINGAIDEKFKHHLEPPRSRGRDYPSYIYDQTAKKLRRLTFSERREYLEALRVSLIEENKDVRDSQFHQFFIGRFMRAMEERDIYFTINGASNE